MLQHIAHLADLQVSKAVKTSSLPCSCQEPISLETTIGEEEDSHLGDFIEDKNAVSPVEAMIDVNLRERTEALLKTLTPREERVIKMRFGIGEGNAAALDLPKISHR